MPVKATAIYDMPASLSATRDEVNLKKTYVVDTVFGCSELAMVKRPIERAHLIGACDVATNVL